MPKKFKDTMQLAFEMPAPVYAEEKKELLDEAILSEMLDGNLALLLEIDYTKGRKTIEPNKWKCWNANSAEILVVKYPGKFLMVVEPFKPDGGENV